MKGELNEKRKDKLKLRALRPLAPCLIRSFRHPTFLFFFYANMMIVVVTFNWPSSSSSIVVVAFHHYQQIDIFIPSFSFFFFSLLISCPTFRHSLLPNIKSNLATVVTYSSYSSCFRSFIHFLYSERITPNCVSSLILKTQTKTIYDYYSMFLEKSIEMNIEYYFHRQRLNLKQNQRR